MLKTMLVATSLIFAGSAYAEEVIIERAAPVEPVAPAPRDSTTTIEKHGVDCDSRTVHRENDLGESKTVTRTNCD